MSTQDLSPIELATARDGAYRALKEAIIGNRLKPGTRLVAGTLAAQLGVSRTPLREALQMLEWEGFVARLSGGGISVAAVCAAEIEEVFGVRAVLEGLVARHAALRRTADDVQRLESIMVATREAAERGEPADLDRRSASFHRAVHDISCLRLAVRHLDTMRDHISRCRAYTMASPGRPGELAAEHEAILDAIRAGDAGEAEARMRDHIWKARLALVNVLEGGQGDGGAGRGD